MCCHCEKREVIRESAIDSSLRDLPLARRGNPHLFRHCEILQRRIEAIQKIKEHK